MKNESQKLLCDFLLENGIENLVGVPDSTLKHFIAQGLKKKKNIINCRSLAVPSSSPFFFVNCFFFVSKLKEDRG